MTARRGVVTHRGAGGLAVRVLVAACLTRSGVVETFNATTPVSRFNIIGTLASSDAGMDIRMMVQVREQLLKGGIKAVRTGGTFENVGAAVTELCGPAAAQPIDGLLMVSYNDLVLYDCTTRKAAYEITSNSLGLQGLTDRLIHYLTRKEPAS